MRSESELYDGDYFAGRKDRRRLIAYQVDADKILSRESGSVLDIGGGWGEFGKYFDNYYCFDPYTYGNELPSGTFDIVVFRGVLQHLPDPVKMLHKAKMRLRPGGLLAILATPDTDSIGYLRWGTLPALDPKRNWIPFGHRMLGNILVRLGYSEIEFGWPYGHPYAKPLKNLFNFIIGIPDAFPRNMMECFARR